MLKKLLLLGVVVAGSWTFVGCGGSEPPPTGETREEAVKMHQEHANREMQDIKSGGAN